MLGIKERAEDDQASIWISPTPTPEVFIPLNPSPTPSSSDLPMTCQVTDLNVFIDRESGYCFAYPLHFTRQDPDSSLPVITGPHLGSPSEPVYAMFTVEQAPYDPQLSLDQQVDSFLTSFSVVDPNSSPRARIIVDEQVAVLVESVPVHLSWRIVFVPHNEMLYRLMYWPVDVAEAQPDLEELYQTTLGSFSFIE
jgi:hypothetical protein